MTAEGKEEEEKKDNNLREDVLFIKAP